MIKQPDVSEYPAYFGTYIEKVPDGDIMAQMTAQMDEIQAYFGGLSDMQADYRYAPGKWSLKEVLGHMVDCERVFAYRALRFARGDDTDLPGFEQDDYVAAADFQNRSVDSLLDEFLPQRQSNIALFHSLDEKALARSGTADGKAITVRSIPFILVGHIIHHMQVIQERYEEGV